jgi:hypothetical protein
MKVTEETTPVYRIELTQEEAKRLIKEIHSLDNVPYEGNEMIYQLFKELRVVTKI